MYYYMNRLFEESTINPTFIFVDGSYYNFYRYYALMNWWKNVYPEEPIEDPCQNRQFVEKFKQTHITNLFKIPKKLNLSKNINPILIVGKDCKRENIWRNKLFPQYKATRIQDGFKGAPLFKMAYEEDLFRKGGARAILQHPMLEADDCIAISVKHVIDRFPQCVIYIITSDKDYLQLNSHNVHLYNLAFKNIADNKSSTGNAKNDLELKILMGDTSDNIPSVFPKCGPKTAQKCIDNPEFFKKKMANNINYYKQYELNKKLVDFTNIPEELIDEFISTN
jgi:5'-3' exonuclease